jgi:hypothetical protein
MDTSRVLARMKGRDAREHRNSEKIKPVVDKIMLQKRIVDLGYKLATLQKQWKVKVSGLKDVAEKAHSLLRNYPILQVYRLKYFYF